MLIQKQSKLKMFGAAMIMALMLVCGTVAFAQATASPVSLQFPSQTIGTSKTISVTITNNFTNSDTTTFSGVFMSTAQFSYNGPALPITIASGQSFTASVTFTPTAVRSYTGEMTFFRRGGAPLVAVALSGSGTAVPLSALTASPSALSFSAQVGAAAPAAQNLMIGENPAGAVAFSVSADQSWISLNSEGGTTGSAISVGANASGLAVGSYSGHVIVSAAGVSNSPMSIPVSLVVAAAAPSPYVMVATPSALSFTGAVGSAPVCQALSVDDTTPSGPLPVVLSSDSSWLTVTPASGHTRLAASVCVNASGLAAGSRAGHIIVTATGANSSGYTVNNSPMSIPVSFAVTGAASTLTAAPSALSFSAQVGVAAPAVQSLTIGENPAGAVAFTASADQAWITLSSASGTTSSAIQVSAKTAGLAAGSYSGHVIVSAAGVTNSPMSIPVTLVVTAAPPSTWVLVATPTSLAFTGAVGSSPACQTVNVLDTTPAGPLPVAMSTDSTWLTVTPTVGQTELNISACVKTAGLAAGTFKGNVIVTMTSPNSAGQTVNNSPMSIPVTLVISAAQAPALTATPSALAFTAAAGGAAPAMQSLTIGENPAGAVAFSMTADQAWMTLSAEGGTTSKAIQVGANIAGLAAGNYTGHVIVTAAGVSNSPMSVTVTLAVTAAQSSLLTVNPTSVAFGNINLANNNTKSVTITNTGTGSVTISAINVVGLGISVNGVATPTTLTAGQSTVLSIVYAPTLLGVVAGSVTVVSNATNSPAVIVATGTGVQPQLASNPTSLSFGSVAMGANGSQNITLSNNGTATATISQATISGSGYTMSGLALPMSLAAGASVNFSVQFAPTAVGGVSGSVTVTSNTPNSPTMIALSGTGTAAVTHSVTLSWVASTSATVVGYNVYRGSVSGGPYTMLNSAPNASTSYTDMTVSGSQTYYYIVTAVDASGNESVGSNEVAVIVP